MKTLLGVLLYMLGTVPTATNAHLWKPGRAQQPSAAVAAAKDRIGPAGMTLAKDNSLRQYTYEFEGVASLNGKPCPNASVLIRLVSSRETIAKGATTNEDGSYRVQVTLEGSRYEPIDWSMTAFTADSQQVELVGRRIAMREETTIVVSNPLQLQAE